MELTVKQVTMMYGNTRALSQINCTLKSGSMIGLVGPNGAGKTTLLKILTTLVKPSSGTVLLNGKNIVTHPDEMRRMLGYLPQDVAVYPNLTAIEFLCYMASMKKIPKFEAKRQISELMEILHLSNTGKKYLSEFSGGMKQRVGIACALLGNPKVLIVDEPTTGLDPKERIALRNMLSRYAKEHIVLLSTHVISDIEAAASKIIVLKQGTIVFNGEPAALISNAHGYIWEYIKPAEEDLHPAFGISSMIQQKNGIKIRQIANKKPCPHASLVEPTLEDACLYTLEGDAL